jgi:cell division protein FtsZ
MEGAHGVLLSISGGSDLGLFEINEAASLVSDAAHADANIIFGAVIDDALGDEVRVTVIAAGFDSGRPSTRKDAASAVVPGSTPSSAVPSGLPPYRRPMAAPVSAHATGERLATPAVPAPVEAAAPAPVRPSPAGNGGLHGGGITVPPLPPIPGSVNGGRRPLSNEDFEEELDIPEFLKG